MKKPKITFEVHRNSKKEMIQGIIAWIIVIAVIGVVVWKLI